MLVALAERGYEPLDELIGDAEAALVVAERSNGVCELEARLVPFRSPALRAGSIERIVAARGEGKPRERLEALLAVLPFADGDDRGSAEREIVEILEHAGGDEAEVLTASAPARRLREVDLPLYAAFIAVSLSSVEAIDDRRRRVAALVKLLSETDDARARAIVEHEARRVLAVAMHASPLLACAAEADIAAFQATVSAVDHVALDMRPALFAAWARHGKWEAAMEAMDRGSPYELARAVDALFNEIPPAVAEKLIGAAIASRDPE